MKKTLSLLSFCAAGLLFAQQVTIGSGTRTDSNIGLSTPISIYYGYSLTQQIYLASEIGGPMSIQQLKFYVSNPPSSLNNTGQVDVWLGHTDVSAFQNVVSPTGAAWIPVAQQQRVMTTGNVTYSGNEITITLDTPFSYNGTQNLVITVDENKPGDDGNSYPFYQTVDYPGDMTLINRSDSANPDPSNPPTNYTGPSSFATTEVQGKKYKAILTLIGQNLGVSETKTIGDVTIAPNPSSDFVTITSKLTINSVDIFDANGRKVNTPGISNGQIDIRNLAAGVYMLNLNFKEGFTTSKKIIKK